jgi:branched-chain amino acid transport system permease protein
LNISMVSGQLTIGLINGAFYAILSLGLAVIFGMLRVVNFAHGAFYVLGSFVAWLLLSRLGLGYWWALLAAPLCIGVLGWIVERLLVSRIYELDPLYGLLLTFGLALIIEGSLHTAFGSSAQSYPVPSALSGIADFGFAAFPKYRLWIVGCSVSVCTAIWLLIEKTRIGSYLRASTENPLIVQSFGINVPRLMRLTYACGCALAALAGVLSVPTYGFNPLAGQNIIIVVFAIVVIGGMGSIAGAAITGFSIGLAEAVAKMIYPEMSSTVIFAIMVLVLLVKPHGLFGKDMGHSPAPSPLAGLSVAWAPTRSTAAVVAALALAAIAIAPLIGYPIFVLKLLSLGLLAASFNLLFGYLGLLSFGHAALYGSSAYVTAYAMTAGGFGPGTGLLLGIAAAAFLGLLIGFVSIKRKGIFFAMITLALAQMFYFICGQLPAFGGEDGIQGVQRGKLLGLLDLADDRAMYWFGAAVICVCFALMWRIINSPFGTVLKSIRDNEDRAISLGFDVAKYKLAAFVMSAAFAGVAGAIKVLAFQFASQSDIGWSLSGEVILMALVGGVGTFFGPMIGAFTVGSLENYLAVSEFPAAIALGIIFVLCVLVFRRGVVGELLWLTVQRLTVRSQARTDERVLSGLQ